MDNYYNNLAYWIFLYLDIAYYSNLVKSYNDYFNKHNIKKIRYQAMSKIVKPIILRDIAVPVSEFYKNFKDFAPEEYVEILQNKENKNFIEFTKLIRNNMKYLPKKNKSDLSRINSILDETNEIVKADSFDGKQDFDYYSGLYLGRHRLYGSPLITNKHIFYEINKKYDCDEIKKYENSIPENLKAILNSIDQVFEKASISIKDLDINISIPNNKKRKIFTMIEWNKNIDYMVLNSGFEKEILYLFILVIQEISAIDFCFDCIFDEVALKQNTILLFFSTKWLATKIDEIIDMFEAIIRFGHQYNLSAELFDQKLKSEVGDFDDIRIPVSALRNSLHYVNASKMSLQIVDNSVNIDINAIFNTVCPGYYSQNDYFNLYNKIRTKLKSVRLFCENNIGTKFHVRKEQ